MPHLDEARAERVVGFFGKLRHTDGQWAGVAFELLPWQREIIRTGYGTVDEEGLRQYRKIYVEIPKKNGKSEFAAGLALYHLCADGESGGKVFSCGADREQASLVFNVAAAMVRDWMDRFPQLRTRFKIIDSQKVIHYAPTGSVYKALSAESNTKHGLNPSCIIFDELHAQPNDKLWNVMTFGSQDARRQPMLIVLTTAGDDPNRASVGWKEHEKALQVLRGEREEPRFLPVVYAADEEDDWTSEAVWRKANPSLGVTIRLDTVREACEDARRDVKKEHLFRWLRLNQWRRTKISKWGVPEWVWRACQDAYSEEALQGRPCWGGLDLSSTIDVTALVWIFPPWDGDGKWRFLPRLWIPEEAVEDRSMRDNVPYDEWLKKGFVMATPGSAIDYRFIRRTINDDMTKFDARGIHFDKWGAEKLRQELEDDGLLMLVMDQNIANMSPPMKELARMLHAGEIAHDGNPAITWMFNNVDVYVDANENMRPIKNRGAERIDGIVALIMALWLAMKMDKPAEVQYFFA